jgi:hypothetical protein
MRLERCSTKSRGPHRYRTLQPGDDSLLLRQFLAGQSLGRLFGFAMFAPLITEPSLVGLSLGLYHAMSKPTKDIVSRAARLPARERRPFSAFRLIALRGGDHLPQFLRHRYTLLSIVMPLVDSDQPAPGNRMAEKRLDVMWQKAFSC